MNTRTDARSFPPNQAGLALVSWCLVAASWPTGTALAQLDDGARWRPITTQQMPVGLDWEPWTYSDAGDVTPEVVALGEALFFDPRLSRSGSMSCASCHRAELGFTDGRARAVGDAGDEVHRNTPSVLNRALGRAQFWDGRADGLAAQALGPLMSPQEMGLTDALFAERFLVDAAESARFDAVFGARPSIELAARAIAAFEATLVTASSPYDRMEWLGDDAGFSAAAQRGLALFRGKAGCSSCHMGPNLSDESFHDVGLSSSDAGRFLVTGAEADRGAFKTPSLRNVSLTAPYMHDGRLASLAEVVEHYDLGGAGVASADVELRPLGLLPGEKLDLVAFLESLTGPVVQLDPQLFREPRDEKAVSR